MVKTADVIPIQYPPKPTYNILFQLHTLKKYVMKVTLQLRALKVKQVTWCIPGQIANEQEVQYLNPYLVVFDVIRFTTKSFEEEIANI